MSALLHVSINGPEVLEADELVKEATIRWTGLKKRTKLPGHITTGNTMTCVEKNNVSVQTDSNFNTLDTELAEKEQHVMELMKQAAKILRLPMDDFDNDIEDSIDDENDADDMWNDIYN